MFPRPHAALALSFGAILLAAAPAEARFGKRSKRPQHTQPAPAPPSTQAPVVHTHRGGSHGASAVNAPIHGHDHRAHAHPSLSGYYARRRSRVAFGFFAPTYVHGRASSAGGEPASLWATLGGDVQVFPGGAAVGVGLLLEGARWGFSGTASALAVGDGSGGIDTIRQAGAHVTYAAVASERGRLRLHIGGDAAFAPDLTALGPSVGASGVLWLAGPLALDASATLTAFPFRQADLRGGVGLAIGRIGLRAGWRTLVLDDAGLLDGDRHVDVFGGPYLGLAVAL